MGAETVGRPMEILLVEDSLTQAGETIEVLKDGQVKHRLTLIRDGAEAMEFLFRRGRFARAPHPDLILLDLRLPKTDGLEVLTAIKADTDLREIPVIVMTVSEDEGDRLRCKSLAVEGYITKPVNLDKFLALVRQLKQYWHDNIILPDV